MTDESIPCPKHRLWEISYVTVTHGGRSWTKQASCRVTQPYSNRARAMMC